MTKDEFLKQQYNTLRAEILSCKTRCLAILIAGIIIVMAAAYLAAAQPQIFANAAIPLVLLVVILAFAAEQNAIIRAGTYIRLHIEPNVDGVKGWEHWLEGHRGFREVDRFYFVGFVVMFLAFFAISCSLSLSQLNDMQTVASRLLFKCAATAYALGLLLVLIVLLRHSNTLLTKGEPEATD